MEKSSALTELYGLFHDDMLLDEALEDHGRGIQENLSTYFNAESMRLEARPLKAEDFSIVYSPALPTVAVSNHDTFGGTELFGLVSYEEDSRANVVYIPTVTKSMVIRYDATTEKSWLEATSGAFVLPSGQVVYGRFPQPIRVDAFETGDHDLMRQCNEQGIMAFQDVEAVERFKNKAYLHEFVNNEHTRTTRRIARAAFMSMNALEEDVVIKPSANQSGTGVRIIGKDRDIAEAKRVYEYLERYGYDPLVEERVHCYKLTDPETGEQLDWNVRAIISYGDVIGMYVRADTAGKPVNVCISARKIKMSDFPQYVQDSETAMRISDNLYMAAQAVAKENPYSIVGIDLTVDNDMETYMYEMDNYVGGMQTIATIEDTYESKVAMAQKILAKYIDHTPITTHNHDTGSFETIPLKPSFKRQVEYVIKTKFADEIAKLSMDDFPNSVYERYGRFQALAAMRDEAYYREDEAEAQRIDELIWRLDPLEMRKFLEYLCYYSYDLTYWKDFLDEYLELFDPEDVEALSYRQKYLTGNN